MCIYTYSCVHIYIYAHAYCYDTGVGWVLPQTPWRPSGVPSSLPNSCTWKIVVSRQREVRSQEQLITSFISSRACFFITSNCAQEIGFTLGRRLYNYQSWARFLAVISLTPLLLTTLWLKRAHPLLISQNTARLSYAESLAVICTFLFL